MPSIVPYVKACEDAGADALSLINTIPALGGIYEVKDAIEFFIAGATAVAVGTATFTDPGVVAKVYGSSKFFVETGGVKSA